MRKLSRRQKRVGELIHQELSTLLQQEARDPRLAEVTITEVEVSPDLRQAQVYVSALDNAEEILRALVSASGYLRRQLAERLSLRFVPEVSFRWDRSLERGQRILELLHGLEGDRQDE